MVKLAKKKKVGKTVSRGKVCSCSDFCAGLKYPWGKPKRLWNILWIFIPILGFLALIGYSQSIVRALVAGNKSELPKFVGFKDNLKRGFLLFVKLLPLMLIVSFISKIHGVGWVACFIAEVFFVPYLALNLLVTDKFEESLNVKKTWNAVFNNLKEYLIAYVKTIGYVVIYALLSLVLVGFPCLVFGQGFFLAEFYAKHS